MPHNPLSWIDDELLALERQHLRRRPPPATDRNPPGCRSTAGNWSISARTIISAWPPIRGWPRGGRRRRSRRLGQRGQPAGDRPRRAASPTGGTVGRVRGDRGGAGVLLRLRRQHGRDRRPGRPRRRGLLRPQEPRQPVGRLPPVAGRRARLSARRLPSDLASLLDNRSSIAGG